MIYIAFTQEQIDQAVKSSRTMTEFLEKLTVQEPTDGEDGFSQEDLDKVIEALRALVPAPVE